MRDHAAPNSPTSQRAAHVWEHWHPAWRLLFVVMLALALVFTAADPDRPLDAAYLPAVVVLSALMLAWYLLGARHIREDSPALGALAFFSLGWLTWYALTALNGVYFLLLFLLFPQIFMTRPLREAIALSMLLNGLVLLTLYHIDPTFTPYWMLMLSAAGVSGSLLAYFITRIIHQSQQRHALLTELQQTRDTLARAQYESGILHERQRLAGELHDTIIQGLIAILTHLEAADSAADPIQAAAHRQRAMDTARADLAEARRFIHAMRPQTLEHHALEDALRAMGDAFVVTGNAVDAAPLSPQAAHALLRIAQEAAANARRHAHAHTLTLTLSYLPDAILLDIHDDGRGFDPDALPTAPRSDGSGFGLLNMRRRVESLGGALSIESAPGEGTTVAAAIPLAHDPNLEGGHPHD